MSDIHRSKSSKILYRVCRKHSNYHCTPEINILIIYLYNEPFAAQAKCEKKKKNVKIYISSCAACCATKHPCIETVWKNRCEGQHGNDVIQHSKEISKVMACGDQTAKLYQMYVDICYERLDFFPPAPLMVHHACSLPTKCPCQCVYIRVVEECFYHIFVTSDCKLFICL